MIRVVDLTKYGIMSLDDWEREKVNIYKMAFETSDKKLFLDRHKAIQHQRGLVYRCKIHNLKKVTELLLELINETKS